MSITKAPPPDNQGNLKGRIYSLNTLKAQYVKMGDLPPKNLEEQVKKLKKRIESLDKSRHNQTTKKTKKTPQKEKPTDKDKDKEDWMAILDAL